MSRLSLLARNVAAWFRGHSSTSRSSGKSLSQRRLTLEPLEIRKLLTLVAWNGSILDITSYDDENDVFEVSLGVYGGSNNSTV